MIYIFVKIGIYLRKWYMIRDLEVADSIGCGVIV